MSVKNSILDNIIATYITSKTALYNTLIKYTWIIISIYMCIYPWLYYTAIPDAIRHPTIPVEIYNIFSLINSIVIFSHIANNHLIKNAYTKNEDIYKTIDNNIATSILYIILIPETILIIMLSINAIAIAIFIQHEKIQTVENSQQIIITLAIYSVTYIFNISSIIYFYVQSNQKNICHINKYIKENQQKSQHARQQLIRKIPKFAQKHFVEQYICKNNIP